jgi:hypothetical protein
MQLLFTFWFEHRQWRVKVEYHVINELVPQELHRCISLTFRERLISLPGLPALDNVLEGRFDHFQLVSK